MNHDLAHCDAQYYIFNKYGECEERHCSLKKKCKRHKAFLDLNGDETSPIAFISAYECAPVYYDKNGVFDVTKRLGCLCCPLKGDKGLADFKKYPKFVRLWIRGGRNSLIITKIAKRRKNTKMLTIGFLGTCFVILTKIIC